jgi:hypothetical protein
MTLLAAMLLGGCVRDPTEGLRYPRITMAILARVDLDHDGHVSQEEYDKLAFPDEPMDPWDKNHDGELDAAEIEDAFLHADPARLQVEGRRAVYKKYGWPFGEPTLTDEGTAGHPDPTKARPERDAQ